MRAAVIDCGTNTFNLLIAELKGSAISFLHEEKIPVKIGRGGIADGMILPEAYERALNAMQQFAQTIVPFKVQKIKAVSTSAFRSATNGLKLRMDIQHTTGIEVEVISGKKEADYIYEGVLMDIPPELEKVYLIMDIGGGSTEFVLYNQQGIFYRDSFLLGASRLIELFHPSDPITKKDKETLNDHFRSVLSTTLIPACKLHTPDVLVGCSGFFDTLHDMIEYNHIPHPGGTPFQIDRKTFRKCYDMVVPKKIQDIASIKGMTPFRAEMMGVSCELTRYVIEQTGTANIAHTTYSLKEGLMKQILLAKD